MVHPRDKQELREPFFKTLNSLNTYGRCKKHDFYINCILCTMTIIAIAYEFCKYN